jgi:ATP-dependent Zn protease
MLFSSILCVYLGADAVTSGASSDLQSATSIAKQMVTKWGMSDKVGPISYSDKELGKLSPTTKKTIDDEINALLEVSQTCIIYSPILPSCQRVYVYM